MDDKLNYTKRMDMVTCQVCYLLLMYEFNGLEFNEVQYRAAIKGPKFFWALGPRPSALPHKPALVTTRKNELLCCFYLLLF